MATWSHFHSAGDVRRWGRSAGPGGFEVAHEETALLGVQQAILATHIQRTRYAEDGHPVETADILAPANLCEVVYEVPVNP